MGRRNVLAIALVLMLGGGLLFWREVPPLRHKNSTDSKRISSSRAERSGTKVGVADIPKYVRIPKLGLQATIQAVGLNKQGNMAAPDRLTDAAWYKPGPRPGAVGNAVIAGHYGKPHQAAFWNLNQLKSGDRIEVIDASNQILRFTVMDTERVNPNEAQRQRIFGESDEKHLNLITCDGAWDAQTRSYDLRLIVYTTMAQ